MVQEKLLERCCKYYSLIFMDIEMPFINGFDTM
jgi:CheY-like chemotaxis protein